MKEENGVALGTRVKDLLGNDLGRVTALYPLAFAVSKGFSVLFREDRVIRYEEVRGKSDGALVIAREPNDLFTLARGELPDSWKVKVEGGPKVSATPSEGARLLGRFSGSK